MLVTQPPAKHDSEEAACTSSAIGRHLLVDMYGIDAALLADGAELARGLRGALVSAGFHVVGDAVHEFPGAGAGITAFFLLSESHAAIHTYPEYEYLALDIFSCGSSNPEEVLLQFRSLLNPQSIETIWQGRGNPKLLQFGSEHDTE